MSRTAKRGVAKKGDGLGETAGPPSDRTIVAHPNAAQSDGAATASLGLRTPGAAAGKPHGSLERIAPRGGPKPVAPEFPIDQARTCGERHIVLTKAGLEQRQRTTGTTFLGATMGHAESHNSFNILFVLTFFASFAMVVVHFG